MITIFLTMNESCGLQSLNATFSILDERKIKLQLPTTALTTKQHNFTPGAAMILLNGKKKKKKKKKNNNV